MPNIVNFFLVILFSTLKLNSNTNSSLILGLAISKPIFFVNQNFFSVKKTYKCEDVSKSMYTCDFQLPTFPFMFSCVSFFVVERNIGMKNNTIISFCIFTELDVIKLKTSCDKSDRTPQIECQMW